MSDLRKWIDLVENVVNFADHQKEPPTMTPDVRVGPYVIHPARKDPDEPKSRMTDYWVWIEGPDRDPTHDGNNEQNAVDIRRYARGTEPEKVLGLPDQSDMTPHDMTAKFSRFVKRANDLAAYGVNKPPETKMNPAWVLWRKNAILALAKNFGLDA